MKIKAIIPLLLVLLLLCGCGKTSAPTPTVSPEYAQQETTTVQTQAQLEDAALEAFGAVLEGSLNMYHAEGQEPLPISKISQFFTTEDMPWTVVQIAVLDLHGDGIPEAILEVSNDIGYVILGYQESDRVFAQGIWHRAFQELKADGSYMASGSSFDHSYYKQHPSGEILLAECYEDMDGTRHYRVDGKDVEEADFLAFEAEQNAKPAATWYPSWEDFLASRQ